MSITLKTASKSFTIDKKNVKGSQYLSELVEAGESEITLPSDVPEVSVDLVLEWLGEHSEVPLPRIERPLTKPLAEVLAKEFDKNFLKKVIPDETKPALLLALVKAANVLAIKDLTQFGAAAIASIVRNRTSDELRGIFALKDDFTSDEKKALEAEKSFC
eukprot:GILJ01013052.1.p1 GENE.GILJ01013052.1~~GILJ01013052.1.p1  ORF type:complete len:160 (+),score=49.42 GILJ01013052.1:49-528(+)